MRLSATTPSTLSTRLLQPALSSARLSQRPAFPTHSSAKVNTTTSLPQCILSSSMFVSSLCRPIHNSSVFCMLIFSPCAFNSSYHSPSASCSSRLSSYTIARSSAYSSFLSSSFVVAFSANQFQHNNEQQWAEGPMFIPNSSDTNDHPSCCPLVHS